jgi:hypothetical protein
MSEFIHAPQNIGKTSGAQGPAQQTNFNSSEFMDACGSTRGGKFNMYGTYTGPTTPGKLGTSPMTSADSDGQSYDQGLPIDYSHPTNGHRALPWGDAPGGATVGSMSGSHMSNNNEGSPWTGPGGDQR